MNQTGNPDAQKKSRLLVVGVAAAIIIFGVLVAIIVILLNRKPEPVVVVPENTDGRGTVVTSENVSSILEELEQPIEDGYYETKMNVNWVFPKSGAPSDNAFVENSTANNRTVYFDVALEEDGTVVYSSPFIPVGSSIKNFALDAELAAGTYPAVVTYHLVDDDKNEITTVSVSVTLVIQS